VNSLPKLTISPAEQAVAQVYHLPTDQPIPLVQNLSYHDVCGLHLWIGVEEGILLVLDDEEQHLFESLRKGQPPALLLAQVCKITADAHRINSQWARLTDLITKLAEADFIAGIEGYHDMRVLRPEGFARLHITRRCQLRCIHCYAMSGPGVDGSRELPTERWMRLIDDIADHGGESVLFTGGEPLLRKDCPRLMRRASTRGLQVVLFTNGLLVEKHLSELADWASLVQVSLNGPNQTSNDAIRGKGTFRRVLRAIELLLRANVPVRVGMTVMEKNWPAIKTGFPAFAERFAGTSLQFHLGYGVCNYGRATSLDDHLDLEEVRPVVDEFLSSVSKSEGRRIARKTTGCGYCEQLVVAPDGVVYPCHLLDGPLGHIDERPIGEWHAVLKETALNHQVDSVEGCMDCDLRNLCGGTCRVINEKTTGSEFVTTCSEADRAARYRNLVRLFHQPKGQVANNDSRERVI